MSSTSVAKSWILLARRHSLRSGKSKLGAGQTQVHHHHRRRRDGCDGDDGYCCAFPMGFAANLSPPIAMSDLAGDDRMALDLEGMQIWGLGVDNQPWLLAPRACGAAIFGASPGALFAASQFLPNEPLQNKRAAEAAPHETLIAKLIANGPSRRLRRGDLLSRLRMPVPASSTGPEEPGLGTPDPQQPEPALVRQPRVEAQGHAGMRAPNSRRELALRTKPR